MMSHSPLPPAGKRLRTMSFEQENRMSNDNNTDQVAHDTAHRNSSDLLATSRGGMDVVGQQSSESRPGTSATIEPQDTSYLRAGMPIAIFNPSEMEVNEARSHNNINSANNNINGDHHDEVVDERIPERRRRRNPFVEELDLLNRIDDGRLVWVFRARSEESDRSSVIHGFRRREFNERDFDFEDDSYLDDDDADDEIDNCAPEEYLKYDPTPDTPYPKPNWITLNELRARKCGFASALHTCKRQDMSWFGRYASSSLWMIQRLELEKTLKSHSGCVNSLGFNSSGSLLCSGSDDLFVCVWDWQRRANQLRAKINSGHTSNVFQSIFCNLDKNIVTSSHDGTVRLLDIKTGITKHLMRSSAAVNKLAFVEPERFLTCGSDGNVNRIDLRTELPERLFTVRLPKKERRCDLQTIDSHPIDKNIIAVAGRSPFVYLYDLRRLPRDTSDTAQSPNCLSAMGIQSTHITVTSAAFNSTGDKLLVSYNPDDLYVFKTDSCQVVHRYQGHRNQRTIKGCTWFGDNYVLSGSDDGHIYGWDLESEHIVFFQSGDKGIVNTLSVHPSLPVLASSGLDSDVKIWEPISSYWPQNMKGIKPQICKNTLRRKKQERVRETIELVTTDDDEEDDDDDDDEDDWVMDDADDDGTEEIEFEDEDEEDENENDDDIDLDCVGEDDDEEDDDDEDEDKGDELVYEPSISNETDPAAPPSTSTASTSATSPTRMRRPAMVVALLPGSPSDDSDDDRTIQWDPSNIIVGKDKDVVNGRINQL